jgi:hypothetical protein
MPAIDRQLAGNQQRAAIVAVVDDLEQIATLLGVERFRSPVVDDQETDVFERGQQAGKRPSPRAWARSLNNRVARL